MLTNLFGPGSTAISVTVVIQSVNENMARKYVHTVSQDFAFGLLSILNTYSEYKFLVNGTYLRLSDLKHRYESKDRDFNFLYKAKLPHGEYVFNSPEVIQGVITAAEWIKVDPHILIKDLRGSLMES